MIYVKQQQILRSLDTQGLSIKSSESENNKFLIRFHDVDSQFTAYDILSNSLPKSYRISYMLASQSPDWVQSIGATPMRLGLDLQGGVHLLYEVDMVQAVNKAMERYINEFRQILQNAQIRHENLVYYKNKNAIAIDFTSAAELKSASVMLTNDLPKLNYAFDKTRESFTLVATLPPSLQKEIKKIALEKNISTIRNRVNELGVSEPLIQRQGLDRIVVELPGVQDPDNVKNILGSTATLEFRLVHE